MYAITESGYRVVTADMELAEGEVRVGNLPHALLTKIRAAQLRAEISQRLRGSDWTQMEDAALPEAVAVAWDEYRQRLRELLQHAQFPYVDLPEEPAE